ncbi:MAG: hypothetical protein ACOCWQ_04470 [Nanoarchaeota archaeon]
MDQYWTSMDRENYVQQMDAYLHDLPQPQGEAPVDFSISQIGSSRWLDGQNKDPLKAVMGDIRAGAGHIELTSPGSGRGGGGSPTFEEIDEEQLRDLRDIQKAVDVSITTHATPSVWGLSGLDPQSNRFSERQRYQMQDEIKKAIDFASKATFGGSVVMHTGEFQRPLYNIPGHEGEFEMYKGEEKDASYLIVDAENQALINQVQEDKDIFVPRAKRDEKGNIIYVQGEDGDYRDPISQQKVPVYEMDEGGDIKFDRKTFHEFVKDKIDDPHQKEEVEAYVKKMMGRNPGQLDPSNVFVKEAVAKLFYKEQQQAQISNQLANARIYMDRYSKATREREEILNNLKMFKELKEKLPEKEYREFFRQQGLRSPHPYLQPEEDQDPVEYYKELLINNDRDLAMGREQNQSAQRQVRQELERLEKTETMREYTLKKSTQSFGELGIYAYDKTKAMTESLKDSQYKDKVKPIFISMENVYPAHGYGSGVDELIHLVKDARGQMKEMLVKERGMDEQKAEKAANQHIKATFDTGHFNMWRRYFKHKKGESDEQYHKRFNTWYKKQVEKLAKSGIIGNVHLADNFGYDDAHLAPGQGNTPVRDTMEILKKHGYDKNFAVEGGFNQGRTGFHEVWKVAGAPVYSNGTTGWTDVGASFGSVHDAYLGQPQRPYFMFGDYTPKTDDWKPWSGTNME